MSSMTTPIVDFVRQYAQSGTSRLHGVYFWREIASASKCF